MSEINESSVRHIAKLARLSLTETEARQLGQLDGDLSSEESPPLRPRVLRHDSARHHAEAQERVREGRVDGGGLDYPGRCSIL